MHCAVTTCEDQLEQKNDDRPVDWLGTHGLELGRADIGKQVVAVRVLISAFLDQTTLELTCARVRQYSRASQLPAQVDRE